MAAGRRLMRFIGKAPRRDRDHRQLIPFGVSGHLAFSTRSGNLLAARPMGGSIAARLGAQLACPAPLRDLEPCSERATRGYPALFCELDPSKRSKPVQLSLLQEARAKAARRPVKSERPGLAAGAFAFCGVRTAFCANGLRARRSLTVGQRRCLVCCPVDPRGVPCELSLHTSRVRSMVWYFWLTLAPPHPHHTAYPRLLNLSAHRFSAAIASALVS